MSYSAAEINTIREQMALNASLEKALLERATFGGIIKTLLNKGADPNFQLEDNHYTAFEWVIFHRYPEDVIEEFLRNGAKVNSSYGKSYAMKPLHAAVIQRNAPTILLLLKYGADIDGVDNNGDTALHYCKEGLVGPDSDARKYYDLLVENGARTDVKNDRGLTPAERARLIKDGVELLEIDGEGHI